MIIRDVVVTRRKRASRVLFFFLFVVCIGFLYFFLRYPFEQTVLSDNITHEPIVVLNGWEEGRELLIEGKVYAIDYKDRVVYLLHTADNLKYLFLPLSGDVVGLFDQKIVSLKGKIVDFIGSYPYLHLDGMVELQQPVGWYQGLSLNEKSLQQSLRELYIHYMSPTIRPIPDNAMELSYHGVSVFFPKKVYYEIRKVNEHFDQKGLSCTRVVYVVGKDKGVLVNLDPRYIRDHARLKMYLCTFDGKEAPHIDGMQYTTNIDHTLHVYMSYRYEAWATIASQIAIRGNL